MMYTPSSFPKTLVHLLGASAEAYPQRPALSCWREGAWRTWTYSELWACVQQFARGLRALGVQPGDRVALWAASSPRWVAADFGIMAAGAINTAFFPNLPIGQIEELIAHSGAWLVIVGDSGLLQKLLPLRAHMPDMQIVLLEGTAPEDSLWTWERLLAAGASEIRLLPTPQPEDLASIIYTSGTSGQQKGVMLTHANFVANVAQCRSVLVFEPEDVLLSVLPLNHVFERTAGCYLPLSCGSHIFYCENIRRLREQLRAVRPTYMMLVPRFLEAMREAVLERIAKAPWRRRLLFSWALRVGERRLKCLLARQPVPPTLAAAYGLADRLVLRRLRKAMGLDRTKNLVSGAAALAPEINAFFQALGVEVLQGYGLTEAAPVVSVNRPGAITLDTVGPPLPGIEVTLGEQNEILVRGPNVMRGYYRRPEESAAALEAEGWLHTGDVGTWDGQYLRITDRLKDILVLTNGKNVAPQPIELRLCRSPYVAQALVLGDGEDYVTALIVPNFERLQHWARAPHLVLPDNATAIIADPEVRALFRREIERLTEDLADFEQIRDFRLLSRAFTIESGEMTPTLKLRRRIIVQAYQALIDEMYGRRAPPALFNSRRGQKRSDNPPKET